MTTIYPVYEKIITPELYIGADATEELATKNRLAINRAVDDFTGEIGGTIRLPAGVIMVTGTGSASDGCILMKDNVTLEGVGMGITTIRAYDSGDNQVTGIVRTQSGIINSYVDVRDLTIDGNKDNQTGTGGNIGYYTGVTPASSDADNHIRCTRVEIINCKSTGSNTGYGFDAHEVTDNLVFVDCISHANERDGFTLDGCINFSVSNCRSYSNGRHGFNCITGSQDGNITNSVAYSNTDNGIVVQENALNINIVGNVVHSNSKEGILIRAGSTVTNTGCNVTGNIIRFNNRDGLTIRGSSDNIVSGNNALDNGQTGGAYYDFLIETDSTNVATNNFICGNNATARQSNKTDYGFYEDAGTNPPNKNVFIGNNADGQDLGEILVSGANTYAEGFSYTVASAPTASDWTGKTIYVSNGAAGSPILAFSDGTNWLRSDTGAAIASS